MNPADKSEHPVNPVGRFLSYLFQKPQLPKDLESFCETETKVLNETRFRYFAPIIIVGVSIILIVYLSLIAKGDPEGILIRYIITNTIYLVYLTSCYVGLLIRRHLKKEYSELLFYAQLIGTLIWTSILSVLGNGPTTVVMALFIYSVAFVFKPRAYLNALLVIPLTMIAYPIATGTFDLSTMISLANIIFCCGMAMFLCRITYNSFQEAVASKRIVELQNIELKNLSETDSLTQLYNRRKFDEILQREWNKAIRSSSSLALIVFDIDYFKQYNDAQGHQKGDEALMRIGYTLKSNFMRASEFVARWGGEEFACIMTNASAEDGELACKRLLEAIEGMGIPHPESTVADMITVSVGATAGVPKLDDILGDFIEKADGALYEAKARGRNCYVFEEIN